MSMTETESGRNAAPITCGISVARAMSTLKQPAEDRNDTLFCVRYLRRSDKLARNFST